MKNVLKDIFSAENGQLSSKRIVGVFAWVAILTSYTYAVIADKEMKDGFEFILYTASALLGVDSVMKPFKKAE